MFGVWQSGELFWKGQQPWAASIDRASNGSIKIALFPAQQLGKAFDHYNMARDGIVDISHVNPGYEPAPVPTPHVGRTGLCNYPRTE